MFTFVVLIITIIICLSHVVFGHFKYLSAHNYKIDMDGVDNGRPPDSAPPVKSVQTYVALVLQDPNTDETGSGEDEGQGSSQDEVVVNEGDFQSGEDSLIENEVRQ